MCYRYAMSFAGNDLKKIYVKRTPELNKIIHVISSAFKANFTWHNMRTLQVRTATTFGVGYIYKI
jgi:acyl-CoA oxidase